MPKKIESLNSEKITNLIKAQAINELRHDFGFKLKDLLDYFDIKKSTFFENLKRIKNGIVDKHKELKALIKEIFEKHKGRYGYRRITYELENLGYHYNHKLIQKLMKELGLKGIIGKVGKRYNSYKGEVGKVCDNILNRDFTATRPNEKWVTDVTEFKVGDDKVYLSPIIDLFNGEVVSYNISLNANFEQVRDMLNKAFAKLSKPTSDSLLFHSDQGWQYQHQNYQQMLKNMNITQSMSRKATCLDNAMAENFFSIVKKEFYYAEKYTNVDIFIKELEDYIYYYNNDRIKLKLKTSPVKYRTRFQEAN